MECQFLYCGDILELLLRLHSVPDRRRFTNFYREFCLICLYFNQFLSNFFLSVQDHPLDVQFECFILLRTLVISYLCFSYLCRSSDDGTCRIWDARYSQWLPRIYVPNPLDAGTGKEVVHYYVLFNVIKCSVIDFIGSFSQEKAIFHLLTRHLQAMHQRVIKYYVVRTMLMEPFSSRVALTAMRGSVLNF